MFTKKIVKGLCPTTRWTQTFYNFFL